MSEEQKKEEVKEEIKEETRNIEKKELVETKNNDLDVINNEIPVVDTDIDTEDISIPRIKLLQALSKEVQDKIAQEGKYFNNTTNQELDELEFIPIVNSKSCVKFDTDNRKGNPLCRSLDGKTSIDGLNCETCRDSQWTIDKDKQEKKPTIKPKCDKSYNFLIIQPSQIVNKEKLPYVISFLRSQIKDIAKKIIAYKATSGRNYWDMVWKITTKKETFTKGSAWVSTLKQVRETTIEEKRWAYEIYKIFGKHKIDTIETSEDIPSDVVEL